MKLKNIAFCAAMALLLAACAKEPPLPGNEPAPVRFTAGVQTYASDTAFVANDSVGIYMLASGTFDVIGGADGMPAANRQYRFLDGVVAPFTPDQRIFYPQNDLAVDFVAYHPYRTAATPAFDINLLTSPQIDLLRAVALRQTRDSLTVDLPFTHRLAKLTLEITLGEGIDTTAAIASTLTGMSATASLNLVNDTLVPGVQSNITLPGIPPAAGVDTTFTTLVIPQIATSGRTVLFEIDERTYRWDIPQIAFEEGKHYTYALRINRTRVDEISGGIIPWDDPGTPPTEVVPVP